MEHVTLVLDNIRSAYNVGAVFRSAASFGVTSVVCLGITPHPRRDPDPRLPHVAEQAHRAIAKTALGAETVLTTYYFEHASEFLTSYTSPVLALEQSSAATPLPDFVPPVPSALVIGSEVEGVTPPVAEYVTEHLEIPHTPAKESLNAATACGIGLYDYYRKLDGRGQNGQHQNTK